MKIDELDLIENIHRIEIKNKEELTRKIIKKSPNPCTMFSNCVLWSIYGLCRMMLKER